MRAHRAWAGHVHERSLVDRYSDLATISRGEISS
jgi:hypothetical protein